MSAAPREADPRLPQIYALLSAAGLEGAELSVAGHDAGIAVIGGVAPDRLAQLAELAPAIRATGFRYVTLELADRDS